MRLTNFIMIFGIIAIVLYAASLLFRLMHWPGNTELRYASFVFIILGLILYGIDWFATREKRQQQRKDDDDYPYQ